MTFEEKPFPNRFMLKKCTENTAISQNIVKYK